MSDPKRIVFLDITAPKPYDANTLATIAQGGTESTVTRIAETLAKRGHDVVVAQHNRSTASPGVGLATYISLDNLDQIHKDPHAVIALRTPKLIPFIRKQWTNSKLFLWCHDFNQQELVQDYAVLHDTGVKILGVSRTHKSIITDALLSQVKDIKGVTVDFIYNPVADDLMPDETPTDPNKLVFFSSPHKGLDYAVKLFERLKSVDSRYQLYIANPGYLASESHRSSGIFNLGCLPHCEVLSTVRSAFAVFQPNTAFPETFGLVYAEANAVGVPAIAHQLGAIHEVLNPAKDQIIDCRDEKAVIDTLQLWREKGRPAVSCKPEFRMTNVIEKWEALLK